MQNKQSFSTNKQSLLLRNQILKNWQNVKLGDVGILNPSVSMGNGKYPYIPMEDLNWNKKYVAEREIKEFKGGAKFEEGDVLLARITPCLENGKIGKVKSLTGGKGFGSTEYFVIRGKDGVTDTDFLYYLCRTNKLRQTARNSMVGASGRQRANIDSLQGYELDLPDFPEQQKIASILSAFDDKIEINNKIAKVLEEMAQALFKEWFVYFRFPGYEKAEFVNSEVGRVPKGWKVGLIKDLGRVITGKTPSTEIKENFGSEFPFITIPDINSVFITNTERYLSEKGIEKMKNMLLSAGSICVSCIATVGLVGITTQHSLTNQQINSVIPSEEELIYFLYLYFKNKKKDLELFGSGGTATLIINKTKFENLDLIIPDKGMLKDFHSTVKPMYGKILSVTRENQKLAALRDLLLPKLMKGEIRVSEK